MRYIKLSFEYIFRNVWWMLALSLAPGIILGLTTRPTSIFTFMVNFNDFADASFSTIIASISELNWYTLLFGILLVPIFAIFISALCGIESRHMRLGIRDLKCFFKRVNNNFMSVIMILLTVLATMQIQALLFSSFSYLWISVISSVNVALAMSAIVAIVLMLLFLFFVSLMLIWLPTMSITGLNANKAMAAAISGLRGKVKKVFISVTLPLIPIFGISCLMSYYEPRLAFLVNIVLYTVMVMYYVTLMYVTYCDINDIDREDKKDPFISVQDDSKED